MLAFMTRMLIVSRSNLTHALRDERWNIDDPCWWWHRVLLIRRLDCIASALKVEIYASPSEVQEQEQELSTAHPFG